MARTLLCGALLYLIGLAPVVGAVPDVRAGSIALALALDESCPAAGMALTTARDEAARVWSAGDVTLRWTSLARLPYRTPRAGWLVVRCTFDEPTIARGQDVRTLPVAAIRFIGPQPTNVIVVNLGHARFLLGRDAPESRELDTRFKFVRERRLGRMVGRAVAHEIGHFLTQSGAHTEKGLMRATHSVAAFTGESLGPFRVDGVTFAAPPLAAASAPANSAIR